MPARHLLLAGLVLLAAALRLWGLDFGLPFPDGRPDEREMLAHTAGFPRGDLNPRWFVYPNLFFYVSYGWIELVLAVRRLWVPTPPYERALATDLPALLLAGRLLSAIAGTATVWLVYRVSRRRGGELAGLVAAALLATCWLHVRDSHYLKTEALLAAGLVGALALLARWVEDGRRTSGIAAAVTGGLAMGIKYPALLLAVPAWAADVVRRRDLGRRRWLPSRDLVLMGLVALVVFALSCPYLLLDAGRTRDTAWLISTAIYATRPDDVVATSGFADHLLWWIRTRTYDYHLGVSLRHGSGLLQAGVLALALPWALARRHAVLPFLTAVLWLASFAVIGASPVHQARYFAPLTPLGAILLGHLVADLCRRLPSGRSRALAAAIATLVLVAEPLWASVQADRIMARTDTRVLATRWMAAELPADARLALIGGTLLPQGEPKLPPGLRRVLAEPTPAALRQTGATHVLTHDHPLMFSTVTPETRELLRPHLALLADFSPFRDGPAGTYEDEDALYVPFSHFRGVVRPGPHIQIWAVRP